MAAEIGSAIPPASPMADGQGIAIPDLADELGAYRASIFKVVARLGIQPNKRRDVARKNQLVSIVTPSEALAIREAVLRSRAAGDAAGDAGSFAVDEGMCYLIQLEPECDPGRLKVGFTTDLEGRLRHHRCAAPFAVYKRHWPCRRTWERAAIDCMTNGLEQLLTEVFRGSSLEEMARRGDGFFAVMPPVRVPAELSSEEETVQ